MMTAESERSENIGAERRRTTMKKISFNLLLVVTAVTAFSFVQPVKAERNAQAGPTVVAVPDSGSAGLFLGLAVLRPANVPGQFSRLSSLSLSLSLFSSS